MVKQVVLTVFLACVLTTSISHAQTPAQSEIYYMLTVTRAQTGAVKWSQVAAFNAVHPELRFFARAIADEQTALNNELTTYLSIWYNITQILKPLPTDCQFMCNLNALNGREFEITYTNAMITHLDQMRALSEAAAVSARHDILRQTALETASYYTTRISQLKQWLNDWYGITWPV